MRKVYEVICRKYLTMEKTDNVYYIQIISIGQGGAMSVNSPKWYTPECQAGSQAVVSEKSQGRKKQKLQSLRKKKLQHPDSVHLHDLIAANMDLIIEPKPGEEVGLKECKTVHKPPYDSSFVHGRHNFLWLTERFLPGYFLFII